MLGVDERENDSGRSDTMIVITVNPEKQTMKMLSIPRDTRTEIIGHDSVDKINHAYAFGGVPMAMDTVENFFRYSTRLLCIHQYGGLLTNYRHTWRCNDTK